MYALVEGYKLECVCDLRLPAEASVYTYLMVLDMACMCLFIETGGHALP